MGVIESALPVLAALLGVVRLAQCHSPAEHASCSMDYCRVQLAPDLRMRYKIEGHDSDDDGGCSECKISVQVAYDGYTWLGLGVSSGGNMIGSHAVLGQPGVSSPKTYYLAQKSGSEPDLSDVLNPTKAEISDGNIEFVDGETVMDFTISLSDWGAPAFDGLTAISLTDPLAFIWAHGKMDGDVEFGFHGPTNMGSHTVDNLMANSESMELNLKSATKSKWMAHGIMAFVAWGVFAPLAVTTAILRDCKAPAFLKGLTSKISEKWLWIHVGLNTLAYAFTIAIFSLAVSNINRENDTHWEHAHSKMGLAIFLLASFQVLGGYFRPSGALKPAGGAKEANEGGEEAIRNESHESMSVKSMPRQLWELLHHLLGIALFLFGVWQMYEGIELYRVRYNNSGSTAIFGVYIAWMSLWTVVVVGATVYKWILQRKSGQGDAAEDDGKGTELPSQAETEAMDDDKVLT